MSKQEIPFEEKSNSPHFMWASALLFLFTLIAVVQEFDWRRPWKDIQSEYFELEADLYQAKLDSIHKEIETDQFKQSLQELDGKIAEAKKQLSSPEYQKAFSEYQDELAKLKDIEQDYTFTKADFDEAFYKYKYAQHEGEDFASEKAKYEELKKEVEGKAPKVSAQEKIKDEKFAIVRGYTETVGNLESDRNKHLKEIQDLEEKVETAKGKTTAIFQWVYNRLRKEPFGNAVDGVDRCQTCHLGVKKDIMANAPEPYTFHPRWLDSHDPEQFGCTSCHNGKGPGTQPGQAHGSVDHHWETPILDTKNGDVEGACIKCHHEEFHLPGVPRLNQAKNAVADLGCHGCHEIPGYLTWEKQGPQLTYVTAKTTPEWMFRWIKDPKSYLPKGRMPNFRFDDQETKSVIAYLVKNAKEFQPIAKPAKAGNAENGQALFDELGCKGCHSLGDYEPNYHDKTWYQRVPDLSKIGTKVNQEWLFSWIKQPEHYWKDTRMPSLRLTDDEANDVVAFLMKQQDPEYLAGVDLGNIDDPELVKTGGNLIRKYGCHGCHVIPGMEKESRVSVPLSNFGAKTPHELYYGDALSRGDVKEETWEGWFKGKMHNARMFADEEIKQAMPDFAMTDESSQIMTIFFRSMRDDWINPEISHQMTPAKRKIEAGRRLVYLYNCQGCHLIEGVGRDIEGAIAKAHSVDVSRVAPFAPPNLNGQGAKVQPEWFVQFLTQPDKPGNIRPWLKVRMPTFPLPEASKSTIIEYFALHDGKDVTYESKPDIAQTSFEANQSKMLMSKEYFDCFNCHQNGDKKPGGTPDRWAPDLKLASTRLRYEWIKDWIHNPMKLMPGTKMPMYFDPEYFDDSGPEDVFGGDEETQITNIAKYVMGLGAQKMNP